MVFRRRQPLRRQERLRQAVWPRKGAMRGWRYLSLRVLRLSSSPHKIALGAAAGTASAMTPFLGLHVLIALAVAYLLSASLVSAAIATTLANPLTIPLILFSIYEIGAAILGLDQEKPVSGGDLLDGLSHLDLGELWAPVLKPMLVGMVPLATGMGALAYAATYFSVRLYNARRAARRLARFGASRSLS
ncbi:hypothetical protein BTR14_14280 [Rhizobium rhizosphaerae]|uniref:DUF2062 domain-containing protein n=2 Tax=Xaviernesmea rhizosphaerae TaxID=1672749 RepID=A0ABX3PC92_9HYPH|nr:hypothetical protein BTR14_14280 [Xaviernesmea rhizosphaerae]